MSNWQHSAFLHTVSYSPSLHRNVIPASSIVSVFLQEPGTGAALLVEVSEGNHGWQERCLPLAGTT